MESLKDLIVQLTAEKYQLQAQAVSLAQENAKLKSELQQRIADAEPKKKPRGKK